MSTRAALASNSTLVDTPSDWTLLALSTQLVIFSSVLTNSELLHKFLQNLRIGVHLPELDRGRFGPRRGHHDGFSRPSLSLPQSSVFRDFGDCFLLSLLTHHRHLIFQSGCNMAFFLLPSLSLLFVLLPLLLTLAQARVNNNSTNITSSGAGQDYSYSTNVTRRVVFDVTSGFIAPDGEFHESREKGREKGSTSSPTPPPSRPCSLRLRRPQGFNRSAILVNGTSPGPDLILDEGDWVEVRLFLENLWTRRGRRSFPLFSMLEPHFSVSSMLN